jgi:hypothetical protein
MSYIILKASSEPFFRENKFILIQNKLQIYELLTVPKINMVHKKSA